MHQNMGHVPLNVVAHARKSCGQKSSGTCLEKLWHMPQKYGAHAIRSCGTCSDGHNKSFCTKAITIIDNFKRTLGDFDN